ncbi:MSMEG_0567/Sll0786 family nitrogen starvation N-acetyltransferase [Xylophilus sp. GW821-FHT01B05]
MSTTLAAPPVAERFCDLPLAFMPCEFRIKWASADWEREQAQRLRRAVFCVEQGIFPGDDRDAIDAHAQPLVALSCVAGMPDQVVGTVRIHADAEEAGCWWGSRLAVHPSFRLQARLASTLIALAVRSAHACGSRRFLAHVQQQNVPLFQRLHWQPLGEETLHGRPHMRMQADLDFYPPCHDPIAGLAAHAGGRT